MARQLVSKALAFGDPFANADGGVFTVYIAGGGSTLAQIYNEKTGGAFKNNPFTIGADSLAEFYINPGLYRFEFLPPGEVTPIVIDEYLVLDENLANAPTGGLQFATIADLKNGTPINANQLSVSTIISFVGQKVFVKNNSSYILKTAAQVSSDGDDIDDEVNFWLLGDTDFAAVLESLVVGLHENILTSNNPTLDYSTIIQRKSDGDVTRLYVMPKGAPAGNTLSAFKVFGDDFKADPANYRDFNVSMVKSGYPVNGTYSADGAVLLNMKTLGSFRNTENPDIMFCYNDAISTAFIAGRISYEYNAGNVHLLWTFGSDIPPTSLHASTIAWFTQDMAFKNDVGMRFAGADGIYDWSFKLGSDDIFHLNCNGLSDRITINASGSLDSQGRLGSKSRRMPPASLAYAASITPDINAGGFRTISLTGDITVNAPTNSADGDELTLLFNADPSNRTITFNSAYKTGAYSTTVLANTTNIYKFVRRNATTWDLHSFTEGV